MYLVNPHNITVGVDKAALVKKLLRTRGFRKATKAEIAQYKEDRQRGIITEAAPDTSLRVHLRTVSASPDGYGQSYNLLFDGLLEEKIPTSLTYGGQSVGILYSYPYGITDLQTPTRIIYTMFESTKIPKEWIDYLKIADKVLVPSKFCQKAFKAAGIDAEVVPLGYDSRVFKYKEKKPRDVFTFLQYEAMSTRKGWDILFKAFNQEFKEDEPVKLVLKTVKKKLPFPILGSQYPNISVIKEVFTQKGLVKLLNNADCFVFPSRGEGFGLTPLEALATGTPVIVPNASGMSEYFDPRYFYEIEAKETRPAIYQRFKGVDTGVMIEPSLEDLKKKMRYVYEHRDEAYKKAERGARWVAKNWTYRQTAEKLKVILEGLGSSEVAKPKKKASATKPVQWVTGNILNVEAV